VLPGAHLLSLVSWVGVVVAAVGLAIEAGAARALASAGTSTRAGAVASVLVTAGPFGWSRNPF
jgi:protein-S-isoprenylcysteine O-methyltransferase Ste14